MALQKPALLRLFLWAILLPTLTTGIFAKRGWFDYQRMVVQNAELEAKINQALEEKRKLNAQIESITKNRDEQERVVRQVLGYVRSEELVIEFP